VLAGSRPESLRFAALPPTGFPRQRRD
jgi:hypothetical protein